MGEVRPEARGAASKKNNFTETPGRAEAAAVVAEEEMPPVPKTPF